MDGHQGKRENKLSNSPVTLEIVDRVATITVQREASRNALSGEVLTALSEALKALQPLIEGTSAYAECRAVVLRGAGEKAFVAGADIREMQQAGREELARFIWLGQRVMRELEQLPLPVVAAVHGFAIGGGLELALAADLIVASTAAKLGQAEVNLGLIPGFGGTQRLAARVGAGTAKRLVLTGETISAEEAFRLGVVDYLVPNERFQEEVNRVLKMLTEKSPLAVAAGKRAVERFFAQDKLAGLTVEVEEFLRLFESGDAREGLSAFLEKRTAKFPGR